MAFSFTGILAVFLELARGALIPAAVLLLAALGVAIYLILRRQQFNAGPAVKLAGAIGIILALLAFALTPGFSGASHAQVTSVIDYTALTGASLGFGIGSAVVLYPFLQLIFRRADA